MIEKDKLDLTDEEEEVSEETWAELSNNKGEEDEQ